MDNVWIGDEAVAVEAQYLPDGEIRPTAFTWRGLRRKVVGLGRQWDEADGRHILIEAVDGGRFELRLTSSENRWRLLRAWERPYLV
jgi:hypothetical protein